MLLFTGQKEYDDLLVTKNMQIDQLEQEIIILNNKLTITLNEIKQLQEDNKNLKEKADILYTALYKVTYI